MGGRTEVSPAARAVQPRRWSGGKAPDREPRRECEGVTRDPQAGETRGAQKSL